MLGKLIVHGPDRAAAVGAARARSPEYEIAGVETTLPLFRALVADPEFRSGNFDVQWLDRRLAGGLFADEHPRVDEVWLAAVSMAAADAMLPAPARGEASAWRTAARREALKD